MNHMLTNLTTLSKVAEYGSISKAATALNITISSVSARIKSLEEQVGVELLRRTRQGIALTPAGQVAYRHAQVIADQIVNLDNEMQLHREEPTTASTDLGRTRPSE